ncbi:MAG: 23S rRNA (adenine(1618)-N(6))-methyltransferase RlmF [Epsilonproteobacteria bacterium]|nr:23S rRNA (adenine(1618)-N(6))-methyltransferase RlmF [Campylobacterota bacterium]
MIQKQQIKTLHRRNIHNNGYNFEILCQTNSSLKKFVALNQYGDYSIDFADSKAVLELNKTLLEHYYKIKNWEIPKDYLCPPIPGRADYIHHLADLVGNKKEIKGLDIGTGANCIYPIIGISVYDWEFTASDIDPVSIVNAQKIIDANKKLQNKITLKLQKNKKNIFTDIIKEDDRFDFTMCNPPFHKNAKEAQNGSNRKVSNLTKQKTTNAILNFAGQSNELWCDGGELAFIKKMIIESKEFKNNCLWFTTLVSKKENLKEIYKTIKQVNALKVNTIEMKQGQKTTRFVAWSFVTKGL